MDRVNEVTRDTFAALLQISAADVDALPPPQTLHLKLRGLIDEQVRRSSQRGFGHQDAQDMAYALVALCDELADTAAKTHPT